MPNALGSVLADEPEATALRVGALVGRELLTRVLEGQDANSVQRALNELPKSFEIVGTLTASDGKALAGALGREFAAIEDGDEAAAILDDVARIVDKGVVSTGDAGLAQVATTIVYGVVALLLLPRLQLKLDLKRREFAVEIGKEFPPSLRRLVREIGDAIARLRSTPTASPGTQPSPDDEGGRPKGQAKVASDGDGPNDFDMGMPEQTGAQTIDDNDEPAPLVPVQNHAVNNATAYPDASTTITRSLSDNADTEYMTDFVTRSQNQELSTTAFRDPGDGVFDRQDHLSVPPFGPDALKDRSDNDAESHPDHVVDNNLPTGREAIDRRQRDSTTSERSEPIAVAFAHASGLPTEAVELEQASALFFSERAAIRNLVLQAFEKIARKLNASADLWPAEVFHDRWLGIRGEAGEKRMAEIWPCDSPFLINFGLRPWQGRSGQSQPLYKLAIRLQSPKEIRKNVLKKIVRYIKDVAPLLSVRWTGPVWKFGDPDDGGSGDWKGPRPPVGRIEVGAPLAIAGGGAGACGLILTKDHKHFCTTAGHFLTAAGEAGLAVYAPPQPSAPQFESRIGTTEAVEVFPGARLGQTLPAASARQDYGLIRLEPSAVPVPGRRALLNGRAMTPTIFQVPIVTAGGAEEVGPFLSRATVEKSGARTAPLRGKVSAFGLTIEIIDPVTAQAVVGTQLIEVRVEGKGRPAPGDSGAVCCIEHEGRMLPLGIVVAATRSARLDGSDGLASASLYLQPLSHISAISDMEVA